MVGPIGIGKHVAIVALLAALVIGVGTCTTYNRLVARDQSVQAQWAQVENVYQRRADLLPNLVETVKGAAGFERDTLIKVTEARSRIGQLAPRASPAQAEEFRQYQQAQDELAGAIGRLLVVAERYPTLTATQGFRDLQAQLEGTENRITVERMRYNEAARQFNTTQARFPTSVVASLFGARFRAKAYFTAQPAAAQVPEVRF